MAVLKMKLEIPEPKTVTDILEEVKHEMCIDFCKYTKECAEAINRGVEVPCPLDKL